MMAGIVLAGFAGLSRRQFRLTEQQARAASGARADHARGGAPGWRLARDLHDVLAHSLGGLVIQLDAVDALLEAGDATSARERVVAARGLAADGLAEARARSPRSRDPDGGRRRRRDRHRLPRDARRPGRRAPLRSAASPRCTSRVRRARSTAAQATALQRALQESLSNARKHAPGAPVTPRSTGRMNGVLLTVS